MAAPAPTADELRAALARIRAQPGCAAWPADLPTVLADPVRRRLLRLEAQRAAHLASPTPLRWRPPPQRPGAFDAKRAATGEPAERD